MSGKLHFGDPSGIARKPKLHFGGPDGISRKVRKVYFGDPDGIARQIYTSGARFTLTGEAGVDWILHGDLDADWWLEVLASCAITFESSDHVDVCLIGAGASGDAGASWSEGGNFYANGAAGGGGGTVVDQLAVSVSGGVTYQLTVGAGGAAVTGYGAAVTGNNGGDTSAFGFTAAGGTHSTGGASASGSAPGGRGDDGSYPFGDSAFGVRYGADGGGGEQAVKNGGGWFNRQSAGAGGDDGGGDGGDLDENAGDATVPGGGGGGRGGASVSGKYSGAGADGAIIIRNSED